MGSNVNQMAHLIPQGQEVVVEKNGRGRQGIILSVIPQSVVAQTMKIDAYLDRGSENLRAERQGKLLMR